MRLFVRFVNQVSMKDLIFCRCSCGTRKYEIVVFCSRFLEGVRRNIMSNDRDVSNIVSQGREVITSFMMENHAPIVSSHIMY